MANEESITGTTVADPSTETPPAPTPLKLTDDALIDWEGETISAKELKARTLRQADYSKKTEEVARMRREQEADWATKQAQWQEFETNRKKFYDDIQNPDRAGAMILDAYSRKQAANQEPKPITTADLPTLEQRIDALVQQRLQTQLSEYDRRNTEASVFNQLKDHANALISKNDELADLDGFEQVILQKAGARMTGQFEMGKAKALIAEVVDEYSGKRQTRRQEAAKQAEADKKRPVGIEPPGGRFPKPVKKAYTGPKAEEERWGDLEKFLTDRWDADSE